MNRCSAYITGTTRRSGQRFGSQSRTADGSREVAECVRQVTNDAWHYGQRLTALEKRVDRKLTALFPTNVQKRQSAEAVFPQLRGRRMRHDREGNRCDRPALRVGYLQGNRRSHEGSHGPHGRGI